MEIEAVESAGEVLVGEAGPRVLDLERSRSRADADDSAARRQPERVLDQVRRDLEDAVRVPDRGGRSWRDRLERDAEVARLRLVAERHLVGDLREVERLAVDREVGPVHPR